MKDGPATRDNTPAIELVDVVQRFGRKTPLADMRQTVLDHVGFNVAPGTILCLLGPSGCGKTTLVNLVMGIMLPASGSVRVLGEAAPYPKARRRIGFMPQDEALYNDITAEDNLRFFGTLYGMKGTALAQATDEVFAFTRLAKDRKKMVSHYSGGMKRRLSLAVALLHSPDLLVLDEPTVGLDPEHRIHIWEGFRELAGRGKTLLVTTHIMDEAQRCDTVAMLRAGKLIAEGSPAELLKRTGTSDLESAFMRLGENAEESAEGRKGAGADGAKDAGESEGAKANRARGAGRKGAEND
ncbi:MAG: ABC transporter ATP-binding protein [Eggerthellaceae bacterium]|jgi:ABC-2 type transport system ATP-binding protein|nr:ABC transporter ATP-binding protein [Eggerthellaceae bacterium]MDR2715516.1 ABC transporter ATP-binding protein [Coriobacteriaceae bacterium]